MNHLLSLTAAAILAGSASAQNVLTETFDAAIPPPGWTATNNNANQTTQGWIPGILLGFNHIGWAWHEDEYTYLGTSDNSLVSPAMDLSTTSGAALTMIHEMQYVDYMAHMGVPGDGVSTIEVTTDGGLTWAVAWTFSDVSDGVFTDCIDLSAYDGVTSVQFAIRFYGTYAQEWWVDSVSVDAGGCGFIGPAYSVTGLVGGGIATLTVSNATAGGQAIIGYSFSGAGPTPTPFGPVDMSQPITQTPALSVLNTGIASMSTVVPVGASGLTVYSQAVDLASGQLTNSIAQVIL